VLENGDPGEIYNVGSGQRCLNRDILIAVFRAIQEVAETEFTDLKAAAFDATGARPGHDFCYAADASQLRSLGWQPKHADLAFEIRRLVEWYANHRNWWEPIWDSPEFETYWQSKYGAKLQAFGDAPFDFYNDTHWNRPLSAALL
jgi:dTDP-glucose 4,6-dehydratase